MLSDESLFHCVFHIIIFTVLPFFPLSKNTKLNITADNQNSSRGNSSQTERWHDTVLINKYSAENSAQASAKSPVNPLKNPWKENIQSTLKREMSTRPFSCYYVIGHIEIKTALTKIPRKTEALLHATYILNWNQLSCYIFTMVWLHPQYHPVAVESQTLHCSGSAFRSSISKMSDSRGPGSAVGDSF